MFLEARRRINYGWMREGGRGVPGNYGGALLALDKPSFSEICLSWWW